MIRSSPPAAEPGRWRFVPPAVAVLLLAAIVVKTAGAGTWERDLRLLLLAALGFMFFLFSEEATYFSGRYGWTRSTWREIPADVLKWVGAAKLIICSAILLAR